MIENKGRRSIEYERAAGKRVSGRRGAGRWTMFAAKLALCVLGIFAIKNAVQWRSDAHGGIGDGADFPANAGIDSEVLADMDLEKYPEELISLLERNAETLDYVLSYPDREEYLGMPIDLSQDFHTGEVPLLMQWDRRWGYEAYGDSTIGLSGCGPVCLDMVYLYFTGDTDMTPREMAAFAYEKGYYTEEGTSWSLWTEGAAELGLHGEMLALNETGMKEALDAGGLIVCSMRPGDFTTIGHFIVIRGYDENGFYVNDPNRRSNSGRQWDFDTLYPQIKNLWVLQK